MDNVARSILGRTTVSSGHILNLYFYTLGLAFEYDRVPRVFVRCVSVTKVLLFNERYIFNGCSTFSE